MNNNGNLNNNNKDNSNSVLPVREIDMKDLRLVDSFSYADIFEAYLMCRKHKRMKHTALLFEVNCEQNLLELLEEVNSGTYKIGSSRVFTVDYPKPREIWAAQFRDRIVHHLVYNAVGKAIESTFIPDTYACLKGRGALAGVKRLEHFVRSITNNWNEPAYYLKFDIKNFFVSIDRNILWNKLESIIGSTSLVSRLFHQIIFNDPTYKPIIKPRTTFSRIPYHKSLFNAPDDRGLPIGNLSSQFLANLYLDAFDKYIKHTLHCRHYVRYVDDTIILSKDKESLYQLIPLIDNFLRTDVRLELSQGKTYVARVDTRIDFIGTVMRPWRSSLRPMTWNKFTQVCRGYKKDMFSQHTMAQINSYLGMCVHSNTYKRRKYLCDLYLIPEICSSDSACTKAFFVLPF